VPTITFPPEPSNTTPTQIPHTPPTPSTSDIYAPLTFAQIMQINPTCPFPVLTSGPDNSSVNDKYRYTCGPILNVGRQNDDILFLTAYTLQQCISACSEWSDMQIRNVTCQAAVISSRLGCRRSQGNGANCWLKSSVATSTGNIDDMTLAKLIQ
jgi:hypothetical protein